MTIKLILAGVAGIAVAAALVPAHAASSNPSEGGMTFKYRAYELASAEGRAVVLKRLERSAERHCHPAGRQPLSMIAEYERCYEETVAEAVELIDDPRLAAQFNKELRLARN
ncbi:MAG: UrcA family protein [Pseudomonadota bacterium]